VPSQFPYGARHTSLVQLHNRLVDPDRANDWLYLQLDPDARPREMMRKASSRLPPGPSRHKADILRSMFAGQYPEIVSGPVASYAPEQRQVILPQSKAYNIATLAHEGTHALQGGPFTGLVATRELGATLAGHLAEIEAAKRHGVLDADTPVPLNPDYRPSADWLRQQAAQHGVFEGADIDKLLADNPQWTNQIGRLRRPPANNQLPSLTESLQALGATPSRTPRQPVAFWPTGTDAVSTGEGPRPHPPPQPRGFWSRSRMPWIEPGGYPLAVPAAERQSQQGDLPPALRRNARPRAVRPGGL